jgi:hypothetical protein
MEYRFSHYALCSLFERRRLLETITPINPAARIKAAITKKIKLNIKFRFGIFMHLPCHLNIPKGA